MFKTTWARSRTSRAIAYLRPETAQGMFVDFAIVQQTRAQEAAVRHRADRQVVPQRDHAGELHLPHARVRADGDGVLRRARHRRGVVRVLDRTSGCSWYIDLGIRKEKLRLRPHEPDELAHYAKAASDVEYEFPFGLAGARGHREPHRLRPQGAPGGERRGPDVLRPGEGRALPPVRGRAGRRRRPRPADRSSLDAYRDEEAPTAKGGTEKRDVPRAAPGPRADQGGRAAALAERAAHARRAARVRPRQARSGCATTTTPARSGAATAARTRWARRSA